MAARKVMAAMADISGTDFDTGIKSIVELALAEDLGEKGDITSQAVFYGGRSGAARIITREQCRVSGLRAAAEVCRQVDEQMSWLALVEDGQQVPAAAEIAHLDGKFLSILTAERTLLNFLARLCGIATLTSRFVSVLEGTPTRVAATRKTSPGLRVLEKQAVADGGGEMHRIGLYDTVLVKDNHITAAGGVRQAVAAVKEAFGVGIDIEVEVESARQLQEALKEHVPRVLLDNMTPDQIRQCVDMAGGAATIEASGRIDLDNARTYAEAGADIISVGAITSSAGAIDLTLEVAL